jgi:hypothetical protein
MVAWHISFMGAFERLVVWRMAVQNLNLPRSLDTLDHAKVSKKHMPRILLKSKADLNALVSDWLNG